MVDPVFLKKPFTLQAVWWLWYFHVKIMKSRYLPNCKIPRLYQNCCDLKVLWNTLKSVIQLKGGDEVQQMVLSLGVMDQAVMGENRPLLWMLVCTGPCGSPGTNMRNPQWWYYLLEPGAPMLVCTNGMFLDKTLQSCWGPGLASSGLSGVVDSMSDRLKDTDLPEIYFIKVRGVWLKCRPYSCLHSSNGFLTGLCLVSPSQSIPDRTSTAFLRCGSAHATSLFSMATESNSQCVAQLTWPFSTVLQNLPQTSDMQITPPKGRKYRKWRDSWWQVKEESEKLS